MAFIVSRFGQEAAWSHKRKVAELVDMDGYINCAYCETPVIYTEIEQDHVVPYSSHKSSKRNRIVLACKECNGKKYNSTLKAFCNRHGMDFTAITARLEKWEKISK